MTTTEQQRQTDADLLYERYGKPLEAEHLGEYVAISPEGKTLLGPTVVDVMQRAAEAFGPGNVIFKIGLGATGRWR